MNQRRWLALPVMLLLSLSMGLLLDAAGVLALNPSLDENFDYGETAGPLTTMSGGLWAAHSGAGTNPIGYITTSLSMPSYASSGIGGSATFAASGEDVNRTFAELSSGNAYYAALVNFSSATTTGDYVLHLKDTGTFNFRGRFFAKDSTGNLLFGLNSSSTSGTVYGTTNFSYHTTYLVVVKYDIINDDSALWVSDTCMSTEPITPLVTFDGSAASYPMSAMAIRQGGNTPAGTVDGIRVATTWAEAVSCGPMLSFAKSASPDTNVAYHGEVTYTLTLTNVGTSDDSSAYVTDTLPTQVDFARWIHQPAGAIVSGDQLTWSGTVTAGEAISFTFVVAHVGNYGDVVTNIAEFSGTNGSGTAEATFTVESLIADVTFVYHDLEDVVRTGDQLYLVGDFNGWSTTATPMPGDATGEVFTVTVPSLVIGNTYGYKYVVKSGGDQWDWLQAPGSSGNRSVTVEGTVTLNDYRDVVVGWAKLQWPPTLEAKAFQPTDPVYGRLYIHNVTNGAGEGRGIHAAVGYGQSATPADWTWFPTAFFTDTDGLANDEFMGVITPTASGVYSYAVRFDGNWGPGNPNAGWVYGDLDGNVPGGDPFELDQTGVMTVIIYDVEVIKTAVPAQVTVEDGLGALVTHTITINNLSTLTDTVGVIVTDLLPPGFVYVSDTAPVPPTSTDPPIWSLTAPIAAGESLSFQVVVSATDAITRSGAYVNVATIEVSPPDWVEANNEAEATVMVYRLLPIAEARLRPIDELVLVEGTVTVEPGVFKESTLPNRKLYMEDDSGGVLVYRASQLDPVARGNKVRVLGTMAEYRTETELVPALAADVIDLGPTSPIIPLAIDTGAVDESVEGELVRIAGTIIDKPSTYQLQVDDGSGMVWVYRYYNLGQPTDPNYIDFSTLLVGDYVSVTGVTRGYDYSGTVRREILPRGPADVSKPVADLTTSTKVSDPAGQQVRAGDLVTYTITLINTGGLDATATAIDSLPGYYTVYDAGDFAEAPAGTLTWTGTVPGGGQVELQFVAQVIDGLVGLPLGVTPLANSVLVDDGIHESFYVLDPLPPWVIKYGVYLPIVSRNQ
jgi:uncharacterized repeat protein (TIGR01451 family)